MTKKYFEPVTDYSTGKVRMLGMKQETANFVKWVRNQKKEEFESRPNQIKVLDAYFSLLRGEGKTTLAKYLSEYDAVYEGALNSGTPVGKEKEQFVVFQSAFIMCKYFSKGNLRPIESFVEMIADISNKTSYGETREETIALFHAMKSEIEKALGELNAE